MTTAEELNTAAEALRAGPHRWAAEPRTFHPADPWWPRTKQSDSGWHLHGDTLGQAPPAACCLPRSTAPPLTTPNTPAIGFNTLAPVQGGGAGGRKVAFPWPCALVLRALNLLPGVRMPPTSPGSAPNPAQLVARTGQGICRPRALGLGFPWRSARRLLSQGGRPGHLSPRWWVGMSPCSLMSWAWGPPQLHPWQCGPFLQRGWGRVSWSLGTL